MLTTAGPEESIVPGFDTPVAGEQPAGRREDAAQAASDETVVDDESRARRTRVTGSTTRRRAGHDRAVGSMGLPGRLSASGAWQLSASTTRGISASAACRLSASARIPASATGRRGLSAAEGLCTPAASWWISASAARGLWTSGPSDWGGPGSRGGPAKKSPVMIIAIVAAAIVLLAAVGGIVMVLTRGGGGEQPNVTITPSQPVPPTGADRGAHWAANDSGTPAHTHRDVAAAAWWHHQSRQRDRAHTGQRLGVKKTGKNVAQLSDGESVFLGQSLQISQSTNPAQLCDAWHRNVAEGIQRQVPGSRGRRGRYHQAQGSNLCCRGDRQWWPGHDEAVLVLPGFGPAERRRDGHRYRVLHPQRDTAQLNTDFTSMINSMLKTDRRRIGGKPAEDSGNYARLRAQITVRGLT